MRTLKAVTLISLSVFLFSLAWQNFGFPLSGEANAQSMPQVYEGPDIVWFGATNRSAFLIDADGYFWRNEDFNNGFTGWVQTEQIFPANPTIPTSETSVSRLKSNY